jgi:hypothetical protein
MKLRIDLDHNLVMLLHNLFCDTFLPEFRRLNIFKDLDKIFKAEPKIL